MRFRENPIFLLDCLYSGDDEIRAQRHSGWESLLKFRLTHRRLAPREAMIDQAYSHLFEPLTKSPVTGN